MNFKIGSHSIEVSTHEDIYIYIDTSRNWSLPFSRLWCNIGVEYITICQYVNEFHWILRYDLRGVVFIIQNHGCIYTYSVYYNADDTVDAQLLWMPRTKAFETLSTKRRWSQYCRICRLPWFQMSSVSARADEKCETLKTWITYMSVTQCWRCDRILCWEPGAFFSLWSGSWRELWTSTLWYNLLTRAWPSRWFALHVCPNWLVPHLALLRDIRNHATKEKNSRRSEFNLRNEHGACLKHVIPDINWNL